MLFSERSTCEGQKLSVVIQFLIRSHAGLQKDGQIRLATLAIFRYRGNEIDLSNRRLYLPIAQKQAMHFSMVLKNG